MGLFAIGFGGGVDGIGGRGKKSGDRPRDIADDSSAGFLGGGMQELAIDDGHSRDAMLTVPPDDVPDYHCVESGGGGGGGGGGDALSRYPTLPT